MPQWYRSILDLSFEPVPSSHIAIAFSSRYAGLLFEGESRAPSLAGEPHTAFAELLEDLVVGDTPADHNSVNPVQTG